MTTVFIFTSVHHPFDTRIYKRQAISLVKAGYQVSLVAAGASSQQTVDGINIIGIPKPKIRVGRIFNWPRFIKIALVHKADIVHFHDPDLLLVGYVIKLLTRKPIIYDCHELYRQAIKKKRWIPKFFRSSVGWAFEWVEQILVQGLTVVVASPSQKEYLPRATVIKNFPDLNLFDLEKQPNRSSAQLVYLGEMILERGVTDFIEARKLLGQRAVNIILMGRFSDEVTKSTVEALISKYNLHKQINYLGIVPYEQGLNLLSQSAIGVIPFRASPSLAQAIPTKMFEYMACALPIVATNLPLITPFIQEADCGLIVPPEDPQAFAGAIEYLLDNPQEARRMGENGRRAVIEKYNWDSESQVLLNLYKTLL